MWPSLKRALNRKQRHQNIGTVFFHYPCFDGLVSAILAAAYLEFEHGWDVRKFQPVNYSVSNSWLQTPLPGLAAVVDFLYHPDADFWADHHGTTFLTDDAKHDYDVSVGTKIRWYDPRQSSCALLLWNHVCNAVANPKHYRDIVDWADRIDSANYSSVEEAVFATHPAAQINATLAIDNTVDYCQYLINALRFESLDRVVSLTNISRKIIAVQNQTEYGLSLVRQAIRNTQDDIAVFEVVEEPGTLINRYSAFMFLPHARYSVGLVHSQEHSKITAMRNPWRHFESVRLGEIFKPFGGGGHQRVASLLVAHDDYAKSRELLECIVDQIRVSDRAMA